MAAHGAHGERDDGGNGKHDAGADYDKLAATHGGTASPGAGRARPALALGGERAVAGAWGAAVSRVRAGRPDF